MEEQHDGFATPAPTSERPAKRRRTGDTSTVDRLPREVGIMRSLPSDQFSSFVGSASGVYFIRSVYDAVRRSNPGIDGPVVTQTPESDVVPGEDDYLPTTGTDSSSRLWKDSEVSDETSPRVSFQELVDWSASYFANWHVAYPFLHAPTVLGFFDQFACDINPQKYASKDLNLVIVRSIMSMSLADRRQDGSLEGVRYPAELVFPSYDAAIDSLYKVLSRPSSLLALQAAISVQLFLVSMLRLKAASRLGGLIIRMALQLGLHRCPNRFPSFSIAERELRQRMFWSLYCIDRHICQAMGLPLSLRDDDIDVCYPIRERHAQEQPTSDSRLRLLTMMVRHSEIRSQIMELRNKSIQHMQKETDQAVGITAKLVKWWNDVEDMIDSGHEQEQSIKPYHATVLTVIKHELTISLNRPILAASTHGPAYQAALQHCISASRSIITALHDCIQKPDHGVSLLWPSFTWAVWMSTFVLFYAANKGEVSQSMVSRFADKSLATLQHLARRGSVWPEACAAAIRDLNAQMTRRSVKTPIADRTPTHSSSVDGLSHQPPHSRTSHQDLDNRRIIADTGTPSPATANPSNRPEGQADWRTSPHVAPAFTSPTGAFAYPSAAPQAPQSATFPMTDPNRVSLAAPGTPANGSTSNIGFLHWEDFMQNNGTFDSSASMPTDGADPFAGFDIPFWLGQDQYAGMLNEWG
ncbi:hypothetical protein BU24DRAFT_250182 [Aaosphaeria arxii CBS 175.79]|uniref:Xylanolytic transcriptional activator regulatory domain-containing protein n=1 Tax=Aaosphaeria arxii CBS 175.79 TaxID=1450172 RepID=A0A6A5XMC0_9PLEO|nr:uncharacterized protein BU24DRAFT_250182 [Aaosphaeria arxii CBS 175.79]KAF2013961.1 hypothetical protein BU24DRAFT_250182 [Aaosphaeria arxii CBS 175.79]